MNSSAPIKSLLDTRLIRYAGLSEVSIEDIEAASKVFKVATVQNRYNLVDRESEDVLHVLRTHGIGFIPWFPLAAGDLAEPGLILDAIAKRHGAAPSQVALAWVLQRSPVMLPIPARPRSRTSKRTLPPSILTLTEEEFAILDREGQVEYAG